MNYTHIWTALAFLALGTLTFLLSIFTAAPFWLIAFLSTTVIVGSITNYILSVITAINER